MLYELTRQRLSESLLDAERRRLLESPGEPPGGDSRSALSLVLEVQLPWGRRVRFRVGRMAESFPH
jgi:hypothetical protein